MKAIPVQVIEFPSVLTVAMEYTGTQNQLPAAIQTFMAWRVRNQLPPSVSRTFNVIYGKPETEGSKILLCAELSTHVSAEKLKQEGLFLQTIPGGRCARTTLVGKDKGIGDIIGYLHTQWLPQASETVRNTPYFPVFFERISFFPNVSEEQAITHIYLPLQ